MPHDDNHGRLPGASGGKDFDDGGLVSRRVAHQPFEGVDAAEPYFDLV
jgi:hypothetical protein